MLGNSRLHMHLMIRQTFAINRGERILLTDGYGINHDRYFGDTPSHDQSTDTQVLLQRST